MTAFTDTYKPAHIRRAWKRQIATEGHRTKMLGIMRNVGLPSAFGEPDEGLVFFDQAGLLRIFVLNFPSVSLKVEIRINRHACALRLDGPIYGGRASDWHMIMAGILRGIRGDELDHVASKPVPYEVRKISRLGPSYRRRLA